jgi:hypothetical protein
MAGKFSGRFVAGVMALTVGAAACGYDGASNATGPYAMNGNTAGSTDYSVPGSMDSPALTAVDAGPQVFRASGDLTQTLAAFRASLGGSLNLTAGEQGTGRREINWDAVPAALTNVNTFPPDQFNRVVPRGEVFTTEGAGFRVSDNALADLNPDYANQFAAFSPPKIFISVRSRAMAVHFFVAGSTTPGLVNGFGVVFSDVDRDRSTTLAFFDSQGNLLKTVSAPVRSDAAGFSFAGVTFSRPIVARVRIVAGQAAISGLNRDVSIGGDADLVAMDDFISGEPHHIQ